jgi:hypothetical protein
MLPALFLGFRELELSDTRSPMELQALPHGSKCKLSSAGA